jgi:hypothetical protein
MLTFISIQQLLVSLVLSSRLTQAAPPLKEKSHFTTQDRASASNTAAVDLSPYLPKVQPVIMIEQADGTIKAEHTPSTNRIPLAYPNLEPGYSWHVTTRVAADNKYGYEYSTVPIEAYKEEARKKHLKKQEQKAGGSNHPYKGSPHRIFHNPVNWKRVRPIHVAQLKEKGYSDDQVRLSLANSYHLTQAWKYIKDGGVVHFPDDSVHHPMTMGLRQVITPGMDTNVGHMKAFAIPSRLHFTPSLTHRLQFAHSWPTEMPSDQAEHDVIKRGREAGTVSHDAASSKQQRLE